MTVMMGEPLVAVAETVTGAEYPERLDPPPPPQPQVEQRPDVPYRYPYPDSSIASDLHLV